ncbi:hypothetical protein GCM10009733_086200 [Nonomuraea maheshkhaliensis]|uniref:Aminoglycoside phosphotransferase domain-containing protein n=1 Tax=Nonomuraea maheshkhaliensis TaxID=419590 RepID=A0ABN2GS57_9ACTN
MSAPSGATAGTWSAGVASAYELGRPLRPPVCAARGELGRIWRLDTAAGTWAVKELPVPVEEHEVPGDLAFQFAAAAAGVRLPQPRLTTWGAVPHEGCRVYAWVDLVGDKTGGGTGRETGAEAGAAQASGARPEVGGEGAWGGCGPWSGFCLG